MTYQEMFDKAYLGVIRQGKPSMQDPRVCAYRAPDGCRCGVGHLITDDAYDPFIDEEALVADLLKHDASYLDSGQRRLELKTFKSVIQRSGLLKGQSQKKLAVFLSDLQQAHDVSSTETDFLPFFKRRMAKVARAYRLKVPEDPRNCE